ncbi:hypothetical protein BDW62DRAFT_135929 [Aspergillus aurantiobrunneus]
MASDIPFDIWNQIRVQLLEEGSRRDVSAFRQINRLCCAVAAPLFYRSLTVKFWDTQNLQDTLFQLNAGRLGQGFLHHARHLCLICLPSLTGPTKQNTWRLKSWGTEFICQKPPATEATFLESHLMETCVHEFTIYGSLYGSWGHDWEPLASLISRLHHLEAVDFYAKNQFPKALQQAVLRHPHCQLNIGWPQVLGHHAPAEDHINIDENSNLSLLRLAGLHTMAVNLTWGYSKTPAWVNVNDMLPFVFVAPNLKNLSLIDYAASSDIGPWTKFNDKWRELAATFDRTAVPALDSLSLCGPHESVILRLAEAVDISRLLSLEMENYVDVALLRQIATLFPALERLFINPDPSGWRELYDDHEDAITAIKTFPPLKFLCLRGLRNPSGLMKLLEHHGKSLKGLILEVINDRQDMGYVYPEFTASDISRMAGSCPLLQELQLPIKRSQGNRSECEIYKALGSFLSMHSLVLDLHFDPRRRPIQSTNVSDPSTMREVFTNAATDEKLACSIWNLTATNQASGHLKNLRLIPFGSRYFRLPESYILRKFARQILISRSPLRVQEIGKEARETWREVRTAESSRGPSWIERLLCDIWPSRPGETGWLSDWQSFPLDARDPGS